MPARLRFPACPGLGDQIGLRRTKGFLSPRPPRAQGGDKKNALATGKPPWDSWSGHYGEPAGRNRSRWLMFSQRALSITLYDPEKGQAARSRAHRQRRPMPGLTRSGTRMPAPPGPNMLVGDHAQGPPLPACPRARRADRLAGDEGDFCRLDPLAREEATKRHLCPGHHFAIAGCRGSKC